MRSRSDRRASTHENKSWTRNVLLQCSNNALAFELVLASWDILLLIIESAKDVRVLTRIQKTNEMNVIFPIMIGAKIAALFIIIELATTKVFLQPVSASLRMRPNQNSVVRKLRMMRVHQEHQCLVSIGIMFYLIGLRMQQRNNLVTFEMMMHDSLPSRNLTLTELWHSSCGGVTRFNRRERVLWSELFISRHVDPVIMCNLAEIEIEQTNQCRVQTIERRCVASEFLLLNVGLKHEPTGGDASSPERWMPVVATNHFMSMTDTGLHDDRKTIDEVTRRQHDSRIVSSIIANLDRS